MNVIGLAIKTASSPRRHFAISASAGADVNSIPARRASSSTTAKPMLCRVPMYFDPGLPRPTIAFINSLFLLLLFLLVFFLLLRLVLVLLALLDDFGLGRRRRGRRSRRLRRRRDFLGLRQNHMDQHHFGI